MQLNLKIILLLVIIALTIGSKLKVNKSRGDTPELDKDGQPCVKDPTLELSLASVFQTGPSYANKGDVKVKADRQVEAARNLLNHPNEKSINILKEAARQLKQLLGKDKITNDTKWTIKFNRSVYWGIKNAAGVTKDQAKISLDQLGWVQNVEANNSDATGGDRAGVLALLGDIGTAVMDCNYSTYSPGNTLTDQEKTELKKNESEQNKDIIKKADAKKLNNAYCATKSSIRKTYFPDTTFAEFNTKTSDALKERGGSAIAPRKKKDEKGCGMNKERGMEFEGGKLKLATRSGLLNDGTNLDNTFKANWPWQTLPKEYFTCAEPWAGHYSGSILEVLFMLDTLTKTKFSENDPFATFKINGVEPVNPTGTLKFDSDDQKCKAALAGAFLISIGYHSAIEVKPTIWKFLGKPMPKIFSRSKPENCDANATDDIVALFKFCTATLPALGPKQHKDVKVKKRKE